jgi:hypothetical protein
MLREDDAALAKTLTAELGTIAYERAITLGGQLTRREAITLLAGSAEAPSPA